jgi:RNA polymerase sigma-70 factor (ECF subfamily)
MSLILASRHTPAFVFARSPRRKMAEKAADRDGSADYGSLLHAVASHGDRGAFSQLFEHFAPRIKAFCLKRGSPPSAAEEIAQEAMIKVWRRAAQFDPARASASTWIFAIARNARIDAFRRESRPEVLPEDFDAEDPSADTFGHLADAEAGGKLVAEISTLPPDQAEVVRKAFFEDKTHQEIAQELKLPLGTVKSRIRLALGRLRKSMSEFQP